jgi:RHS repeat-associated protein
MAHVNPSSRDRSGKHAKGRPLRWRGLATDSPAAALKTREPNRYNEYIKSYDLNGNITALERYGLLTAGTQNFGMIDNLTYTYSGNRLMKVFDATNNVMGFKDDVVSGTTDPANDYTYDNNGSMTRDDNKGISAVTYNFLRLPNRVTKTNGDYIKYIYDGTGKKLRQEVYNSTNVLQKATDYVGGFVYENNTVQFLQHAEGRAVLTGATPEYQYVLKDHLGNTRITATTKPDVTTETATLETANLATEQGQFLRIDNARRVQAILFDRTNGAANGYAQRLNGSTNEKYGIAKSLQVNAGDTIRAEVYAKYVDPNSSNWTGALNTLIGQIAANTAGVVVDGANYTTSTSTFPYPGLNGTSGSSGTGPKAYLNWLVFDKNFVFKTGGFMRMTTAAREYGQDVAHERLFSPTIAVAEAGYVYIYVSNEETAPLEVYFDDMKITYIKSPVVQADDYYAFGLSVSDLSFRKASAMPNQYKYNGKEEQDELSIGWIDYGARMYDNAIGRWMAVDPLAEKARRWSPYTYAYDNPIRFIDPDGMEAQMADVYAMDAETGGIELVQETSDQTDMLIDKKTGQTISENVEKGLLKEGLNIKKDGLETENIQGGMQLAWDVSKSTNEEIVGVQYKNESGDRLLEIRPYEGQKVTYGADGCVSGMRSGSNQEIKPTFTSKDGTFSGKPFRTFHTHPGHPDARPGSQIGTAIPSGSDITIARDNAIINNVWIPYFIFGKNDETIDGVTFNRSSYRYTDKGWDINYIPKKK